MINILNKDSLRKYIEKISNGRVTVLYDRYGIPSIMVVIPKMKIKDILPAFSMEFKNNKKFNPFSSMLSMKGIFENDEDINGEYDENSTHPAFRVKNEDGSYIELPYIYLGMFKSTFSFNHSLPLSNLEFYKYFNFPVERDERGGELFGGNFLDEPYNMLNRKQKLSSYENVILRTFLKNQPGSSSWRPVSIWAYSLIRLLSHFSSPFKYRFPHGSDLYGSKISNYVFNKETGQWDPQYVLGSDENFTGVRSVLIICIPTEKLSILKPKLFENITRGNGVYVFDKMGTFSAYAVGLTKIYGVPNFTPPSGTSLYDYIQGELYQLMLVETKGRVIDYGFSVEDVKARSEKVNSILFNDRYSIASIQDNIIYEFPIFPNSFQYHSKMSSLNYKDYVSIPRDIEEYKFDKDSEFYRIFGVGDILSTLITSSEIIDGLFLKPVYPTDVYGIVGFGKTSGIKQGFVPIIHDGNFKKYKLLNGKLYPDYYYSPYDYLFGLNRNNRFSGEFKGLDELHTRLPFELVYNPETRELNWRFTFFPIFNYRRKETFISSLPLFYDEEGRNHIWRSFLDFFDKKNPVHLHSEKRLFLENIMYKLSKYVYDKNENTLEKLEERMKLSSDVDFKKFIKEFRMFILSGLAHGSRNYISNEVVVYDKDTNEKLFNVISSNIQEEEYFSEPISNVGCRTGLRSRGQAYDFGVYPPHTSEFVSGEYFYYRGISGLSNWTGNALEPWKRRVCDNVDFKGIGFGGNVFSVVNLFDYRLLYLPGI